MGSLFHELLVRPIINILVIIYQVLFSMGIPYSLGFSIILLTVFIRLIMYPLITSQLRASKKMQIIAPHISKLKEKHKNDAAKLQQETMRLYKEHGVNPAAGCLPVIIQMPIIFALYSVLQQVVGTNTNEVVSSINKELYTTALRLTQSWETTFFGIPLAGNPSQLISTLPLLALSVPFVTGILQFIQSKMMFSSPPQENKEKNSSPIKDSGNKQQDFAAAFQTQSLYIFPVMIGFFSYNFPLGLSLYWNTFTVFGILQQYHISGLGGLVDWKDKLMFAKQEKK